MLTASDFIIAYEAYPRLPYHCFNHALDVMAGARRLALSVPAPIDVDWDVMDAAALFHDVVYVPGAKDNEALSATFAAQALREEFTELGLQKIALIILDTKDHQPHFANIESCLVSDADMAGFAAAPEVFDATNRRIDDEFLIHGGVDPIAYATGRRGFLETTLATARAGTLFHVPVDLQARHERAIANLEREIAALPE